MSNKLNVLIKDATLLLETQGVSSGVGILLAGFRHGMREVVEEAATSADEAYKRGFAQGEAKASQSIGDACNDAYKNGVAHGYEERNTEVAHAKPPRASEWGGESIPQPQHVNPAPASEWGKPIAPAAPLPAAPPAAWGEPSSAMQLSALRAENLALERKLSQVSAERDAYAQELKITQGHLVRERATLNTVRELANIVRNI